jgi:PAS domain S-box-containing protein
MKGFYAYSPMLWPLLAAVMFLLALACYGWRRRDVTAALPFALGSLFAAFWAAGATLEFAAVAPATQIFWIKVQACLMLPATTAITVFILEYAWPDRPLPRRDLLLLSLAPLTLIALVLTDARHQLMWRDFAAAGEAAVPLIGPGSAFFFIYSYLLALAGILILVWLFLRSPQQRRPAAIMITGQLAARLIFTLSFFRLVPTDLPLDVLAITVVFFMYAVALFAFHIFDPVPAARRMVIEQLQAGVLVLDPHGRIAALNPAAEGILGVPAASAGGRPLRELLPAYPVAALAESKEIELSLDGAAGQEARVYTVASSLLDDWRGLEIGRLLLLHDITAQKRTQTRLVEQQRALAALHERESLARDLHDSIGQVLGYTGFQLEAAIQLLRNGETETAVAQLNRLAAITREAHADVREYILDLRTTPAPQESFFSTLRHYLDGFSQNYGIQTLFVAGQELDEELFTADTRLQLLRVVQEALANARKHGRAHCVKVSFACEDGRVRLIIEDDGQGFDPDLPPAAGERHFGLRFMRERAEMLGGSLDIATAPGTGVRVIVEFPLKE